jgi:catechol 2,3-dioxygenase-like lactoylglutathione lyase family enzyme
MTVQLNHTIVLARDNAASARFLAEILGLDGPVRHGPFEIVETANGVSLDFMNADELVPQHYAFLIGEEEFDEIFGRIRAKELRYWADPARTQPNTINHRRGGRGVYFEDPDGHFMEILTRP